MSVSPTRFFQILLSLLVVGGLSWTPPARAEVFHTARSLKPSALSLGAEMQLGLFNQALGLNLYGGVGLAEGFDLGVRFGLPLNYSGPQYFGLDAELQLLSERSGGPSLSWVVGGHVSGWRTFGLDTSLLVSKVFRKIEPFGGLDLNYELPPGASSFGSRLVGGLNVHISRHMEFLAEIGVGLGAQNAQALTYVSAGLNFYI